MKRLIISLIGVFMTTVIVNAEFFFDVYGGVAEPYGGSYTVTRFDGRSSSYDSGEFSDSTVPIFGLRGGYWFKQLNWLGTALDFSTFSVDSQYTSTEVRFNSISLMLLLRYPLLVSEEYPNGRFYPYAGAGASFVTADVSSPYAYDRDSEDYDDDDSGSGTVLCAGATWFFTETVGCFVEYRAVSMSFDQSDDGQYGSLFWPRNNYSYSAEGDVDAHQFLAGVRFQF
jgi:opacity protein-like surface antigen